MGLKRLNIAFILSTRRENLLYRRNLFYVFNYTRPLSSQHVRDVSCYMSADYQTRVMQKKKKKSLMENSTNFTFWLLFLRTITRSQFYIELMTRTDTPGPIKDDVYFDYRGWHHPPWHYYFELMIGNGKALPHGETDSSKSMDRCKNDDIFVSYDAMTYAAFPQQYSWHCAFLWSAQCFDAPRNSLAI